MGRGDSHFSPSWGVILHPILPSGYISQYPPFGESWMSVYWEIHLAPRALFKELISNIPLLKIYTDRYFKILKCLIDISPLFPFSGHIGQDFQVHAFNCALKSLIFS